MNIITTKSCASVIVLFACVACFTSCLTPKTMDRFVAEQYNNQLPKHDKKKRTDIIITSALSPNNEAISNTVRKTSNVLPLIVYWQYDYRHTTTLHPEFGVAGFATALNTLANKGLAQKLNGQRLELKVEQVPNTFAIVDKAHIIWVIYVISWHKMYVEPDIKDLVVSYKLLQGDNAVKSGKISIKNDAHNKGMRFFQSWKSATSEYLADYNGQLASMSKTFVTKLMEEL